MQSHASSAMHAVSYEINDACSFRTPSPMGVQSHAPFTMCAVSNTFMLCVVTYHTAQVMSEGTNEREGLTYEATVTAK